MAEIKVVNRDEVIKKLSEIKDVKAKKAFDYTRADLAKRVPTKAAKIASSEYAMGSTKLNPNTKAGSGKGHVSANGGTLMDLTFVYRGPRLHVGAGKSGASFKLTPSAHRKNPYQLKGKILKGGASPYGHYSKPYSEGGKYGPRSPFMLLPGIGVPLRRNGKAWTEVAMGLSVPQMVVSPRTEDELQSQLDELLLTRLEHHLSRVLGD